MANKIDLLKITEPTIVSSDTDVFYIRKIGENDEGFEVDDMIISNLSSLGMEKTPMNTRLYERGYSCDRNAIIYNGTMLSDILESECKTSREYFKETEFYDVTESYLAFKFGYLSNIEQVDALWSLAARYGYETIQDVRRIHNHNSIRAFQSTGSKIVFADYLSPSDIIGRQQINFPAIKYANDDIS